VAEELVDLLILVQEPFLQFLPHDFIHALLHLASFDDEEVVLCCCCAKAKPLIPMMAMAKKSFFMISSFFKGKTQRYTIFFGEIKLLLLLPPQWFRQVVD